MRHLRCGWGMNRSERWRRGDSESLRENRAFLLFRLYLITPKNSFFVWVSALLIRRSPADLRGCRVAPFSCALGAGRWRIARRVPRAEKEDLVALPSSRCFQSCGTTEWLTTRRPAGGCCGSKAASTAAPGVTTVTCARPSPRCMRYDHSPHLPQSLDAIAYPLPSKSADTVAFPR